ncbi:MAG: hypothetical protein K1X86_16925 [Ignavibacteria bacterium]|nr:hypothetical protein [Ignavibacteria bacterium]
MQNKLTGKLISNRIFLAINTIALLVNINLQYGVVPELNNSQWILVFFPICAFAPLILIIYSFMFKKLMNVPNPDKSFIVLNQLILLYLSAVQYMYIFSGK